MQLSQIYLLSFPKQIILYKVRQIIIAAMTVPLASMSEKQ